MKYPSRLTIINSLAPSFPMARFIAIRGFIRDRAALRHSVTLRQRILRLILLEKIILDLCKQCNSGTRTVQEDRSAANEVILLHSNPKRSRNQAWQTAQWHTQPCPTSPTFSVIRYTFTSGRHCSWPHVKQVLSGCKQQTTQQ
ncbi:uncharacterized protein CANTADRAFT_205700 [Suhomyces tanzawaensis NRRL Y-17324]|uniref:Uncharacterized protein n=1 Tax=Suhomyces tanzawaensis NRRL Y-17324 TaxID=984487 RepID=A0A1E4SJF3_9ASCO|nr:uncharacterized protein CANTADRAFT_205700 [Suhomyces tanzawaensis NRRL Y-17324]ODV79618.1 hypothetical protein CANTADRAFT_205700 [Suhomyces tanzawaensis NRRL Y-17324]